MTSDSSNIRDGTHDLLSKVPRITLMFWVIKIFATTLGETGGDAVTMTLKVGYAVGSLIFLGLFAVTLSAQVASRRYHAFLYWAVVVATTTVGTTMADYLSRSLGLGYVRASILLFVGVLGVLLAWRLVTGRIRFENITDRKDEIFYWLTILVSNTLGTALGDYTSDEKGLDLGYVHAALIFAALIAVVAFARYLTRIPAAILFWSAYVLTRPLGATVGDVLTKPHDEGGLDLSRISSSLIIAALMIATILVTLRRARPAASAGAGDAQT